MNIRKMITILIVALWLAFTLTVSVEAKRKHCPPHNPHCADIVLTARAVTAQAIRTPCWGWMCGQTEP